MQLKLRMKIKNLSLLWCIFNYWYFITVKNKIKALTLRCYQVLFIHANWLVSKVKTREDRLKRSGAPMLNLDDDQQISHKLKFCTLASFLKTSIFFSSLHLLVNIPHLKLHLFSIIARIQSGWETLTAGGILLAHFNLSFHLKCQCNLHTNKSLYCMCTAGMQY